MLLEKGESCNITKISDRVSVGSRWPDYLRFPIGRPRRRVKMTNVVEKRNSREREEGRFSVCLKAKAV